jgi:hypothetical protein
MGMSGQDFPVLPQKYLCVLKMQKTVLLDRLFDEIAVDSKALVEEWPGNKTPDLAYRLRGVKIVGI